MTEYPLSDEGTARGEATAPSGGQLQPMTDPFKVAEEAWAAKSTPAGAPRPRPRRASRLYGWAVDRLGRSLEEKNVGLAIALNSSSGLVDAAQKFWTRYIATSRRWQRAGVTPSNAEAKLRESRKGVRYDNVGRQILTRGDRRIIRLLIRSTNYNEGGDAEAALVYLRGILRAGVWQRPAESIDPADSHGRDRRGGTTEVHIDPNVRCENNETFAGFEDVVGDFPKVGDWVTVREPESGFTFSGRITRISPDDRLVYLSVDWQHFGEGCGDGDDSRPLENGGQR